MMHEEQRAPSYFLSSFNSVKTQQNWYLSAESANMTLEMNREVEGATFYIISSQWNYG